MKPLAAEWIAKAESDFCVMQRKARVREKSAVASPVSVPVLMRAWRHGMPT